MDSKKLSLHHLVKFPEDETLNPHFPTILALHGRGSNEQDLMGLVKYLPQNLFWVSPRGPIELGFNSFEWFETTEIGRPDPEKLANSLTRLDRFIDEIIADYPVDKNKFFLLGFSQGSVVSISYALTHPHRVAGVIAQSGYLPYKSGVQVDETEIKNKPFILTHGREDPLIPVDLARRSREILKRLGTQLEYHEFDMKHSVSEESLQTISTWLEKQLL